MKGSLEITRSNMIKETGCWCGLSLFQYGRDVQHCHDVRRRWHRGRRGSYEATTRASQSRGQQKSCLTPGVRRASRRLCLYLPWSHQRLLRYLLLPFWQQCLPDHTRAGRRAVGRHRVQKDAQMGLRSAALHDHPDSDRLRGVTRPKWLHRLLPAWWCFGVQKERGRDEFDGVRGRVHQGESAKT